MRSIKSLSLKSFFAKKWKDHADKPVIHPPFPDWVLADPLVLQPSQSPDNRWHLFAHGVFGMYHYTSADGIIWSFRPRFLGWFCMRPYVFIEKGVYYLFYEKLFNLHRFPYYDSHIEVISSTNLIHWSKPTTLLTPILPWHKTRNRVGNVCAPSVIKIAGQYRLYYSSGLVYLPECGFCEPKNMGYAAAQNILGPYTFSPKKLNKTFFSNSTYPASDPAKSYQWPTSARIHAVKDGYLAVVPMYYYDPKLKRSRTDMRMISSKDGLTWDLSTIHTTIISPDRPWKKSHVYTGALVATEKETRIYYNARNGWLWGREAICLSVAAC